MAEVLSYVVVALAEEDGGAGAHAEALAALCDVLVYGGDDVFAAFPVVYFSKRLPPLVAAGGSEGDVPFFAARAIAEACEFDPVWAGSFAGHGAVEALRGRLLAVDSIELAEECLRALHAISVECPDKCLSLGVAAAVLQFFDFFSTSKQKMALKIVDNIMEDYKEEDAAAAVDAAPALSTLLQSTDKTILESAVSCLAMIAAGAGGNAEHMDRLCESNAVEPVMKLMQNDGWKSLSDKTLSGILGLLKDLASVSVKAVKSILELGICELLKQMITYYSCSHSNSDKFQMAVELLYQLLRPLETSDHHTEPLSTNKNAIMEQDAYIGQLAKTVPQILQIAKSGALSSNAIQCIVVISKIVDLSKPAFLIELQKTVNLSSFLTCLLARRNRQLIFHALKVLKTLLEKDHEFFSATLLREGLSLAIEAIQAREKIRNSSRHKLPKNNNTKDEEGMIGKHSILNLAEKIKKTLKGHNKFPSWYEFFPKSVRYIFARSNAHAMTLPVENPVLCQELLDISKRLLSDELPKMSTFEFVQSESTKHLAGYLSSGVYFNANIKNCQDLGKQLMEVQRRLQKFTHMALSASNASSAKPLEILVEKLLDALYICYDSFPVILCDNEQCTHESTMIPLRHSGTEESNLLDIEFVRSSMESELPESVWLSVDFSSKPDDIEAILWPEISESASKRSSQEKERSPSRKSVGFVNGDRHSSSRLKFSYKGAELQPSATVCESIVRLNKDGESDILISPSFWDEKHTITYKRRNKSKKILSWSYYHTQLSAVHEKFEQSWLKDPFFYTIFLGKLPGNVDESDPSYNFLFMLKVLEGLNRFSYQLSMDEQIYKFAEGCLHDLDDLKVAISPIPQCQFTSSLLTNKLELQMQESLFKDGLIPSWCLYVVETCPFLLSFDARWKYFCLTVHRKFMTGEASTPRNKQSSSGEESSTAPKPKKHIVHIVKRDDILESAASMMTKHGSTTKTIEVEFEGEVATGRGPTFEFYTTVSHELQRIGLGMWRGDNARNVGGETPSLRATFGLFPQPWSSVGSSSSRGIDFSVVVQKFKLLGHILARAILDGRILDIPLSKAFYKIMLEQELDIYDIPSFDPELGKTLLEFQALVKRKKVLETFSARTSNQSAADLSYKNVRLEDLCLDFTLPGNPEYELLPGGSEKMVTLDSLEEYVSLVVNATLKSGIRRQIEALMSGINEIFYLTTLKVFTGEEMERILGGEQDSWALTKLEDHVEFEHGYEANSPPVINFLEILREFEREEQRAFIQFTTGAPRLPLGGLASLDPKLTVVRKHCDGNADNELPSVNTCRHFIKLPPYSSKEIMRKKIIYAITECVGSFDLS